MVLFCIYAKLFVKIVVSGLGSDLGLVRELISVNIADNTEDNSGKKQTYHAESGCTHDHNEREESAKNKSDNEGSLEV